jgi:hypothetical protein
MGIGAFTGNNQDARGNDGNATTFSMSGPNGFSVTALGGGAGGKEWDPPNASMANRNPESVAGGGGGGLRDESTRSRSNQGGQGGMAKVTGNDGNPNRTNTESNGRGGNDGSESTCISGSISGDVLTLNGPRSNFPDGNFQVGMTLQGGPYSNPTGWLQGTVITAALVTPSFSPGVGGSGTYRISPAPQTVTPREIKGKMNPRGYGGGGGGGSGYTPGPQGDGGEGGGGYNSSILGFNREYAAGGGGCSSSPTNGPKGNPSNGAGYGNVKGGGNEIYQAGQNPGGTGVGDTIYDGNGNLCGAGEGPTGPRGAFPLPPFGGKIGYGPRESGPYPTGGYRYPGVGSQTNALNNRGGGGGGVYNSSYYRDWGDLGPNGESGPFISNLAEPRNLWSPDANPPPHAYAPLWPTDTGTRNWPGRAGFRQGGRGGSGIVIIRYPSVFGNTTTTGTPIKTKIDAGWLVHQFVDSGSMTLDFSTSSRRALTLTSGPAYGEAPAATGLSYLYVGGGGGGGQGAGDAYGAGGGGGGAGQFLTGTLSLVNGAGTYTVVIGGGGTSDAIGSNSGIYNTSTGTMFGGGSWANGGSYGGGKGRAPSINVPGGSGISGGGGMGAYPAGSPTAGGAGSPQYGGGASGSNSPNPFASPFFSGGGGGGGSGAAGANGDAYNGGNGGKGTASTITGTPVTYAGGGGGGAYTGHFGPEGPLRVFGGTSGDGGTNSGPIGSPGGGGGGGGTPRGFGGTDGGGNTGGGGGGGASAFAGASGGSGGSGVVILSYPNDYANVETLVGGTYSESSAQRILRFAGSGTFTLGLPFDGG